MAHFVYLVGWAAETVFGGIGVFLWMMAWWFDKPQYYVFAILLIVIAMAFHHTLNPSIRKR
ncbi:MAG TPA: hypothetical protein VHY35_00150 [Stellaceae bacterium]|jgi:hypothetical protein|nr:hypothetical protein [Stellaceae bacterium]